MTSDHTSDVRLRDLKARKGHICAGGRFDENGDSECGCGMLLDMLPDFMDLPLAEQRAGVAAPHDSSTPPLSAPFVHGNGDPCFGCQSCFAEVDSPEPEVAKAPEEFRATDLLAEADTVEAPGAAVLVRTNAPDMTPAVPVVDPTAPYGPGEVERAMLDANRRLELALKHEANLVAATEEASVEFQLAYARAVAASNGGAADVRKAQATLASEREYRVFMEAKAARDAMRAITHTLRATLSALQSVSRSVGVSYTGPQGRGR